MAYGKLENLQVSYDGKMNILHGLNLDIQKGELLSLLGPSGCGKSTTLNAIAGLIPINSGKFYLDGKDMTDVAIHKRDFGLVFQSYALFPHMTVFENVAFGLKIRKLAKAEIEKEVMEMLEICNLKEFSQRHPKNMSGGQRQRVALARALVIKPKLLLLDEPLSNLDAQLRVQMRSEIRRIQKALNMTTIFVTHDQEECFAISDRVAIMKDGNIEQLDTPEAIYQNPKTKYIAEFVGFENFFTASQLAKASSHDYAIRSQDITISGDGCYRGRIERLEFLGEKYKLTVASDLGQIIIATPKKYQLGDSIQFELDNLLLQRLEK